jgi:putative flavoprotein involved in K+ transport
VIIVGGGQSGLAAARALLDLGIDPLILEAGERPTGSWPRYYDSLRVFSPAAFSAFPGTPFPGDADDYPTRDQVAAYIAHYAESLGVEIRVRTRVETVRQVDGGFTVRTTDGEELSTPGLVAASGSFDNPYTPDIPGLDTFTGEVLHIADYQAPDPYDGKRVVVVGGANSAVQVGYELSEMAATTLATLDPLFLLDQRPDGRDLHHLLAETGFDDLPPAWLIHVIQGVPALDTGPYHQAVASGRLGRRDMFDRLDGDAVIWSDGSREPVDVILFATGYRPSLSYLHDLGALDADGMPLHTGGISTTHPGLVYVGLEFQRSFSSNTLRGVHRDAEHVARPLAAHVNGAAATLGFVA